MIRQCRPDEIDQLYLIINEAARAYDGFIPADCYHQPYMPEEELEEEIKRVAFYGWEIDGEIVGVMGIEPIKDVTLIRHAYVLPEYQNKGVGSQLIENTIDLATKNNENAIIILGHPRNYCRYGFKNTRDYLISDKDGRYPFGQLVLELKKGIFQEKKWN